MGVTIALLVGVLLLVGVWLWRSSQTADLLASQAALLASQVVAAKAANTADSDIETRIQLAADALRRQPDLDTQRLLLASIFSAAKPLPEIRVENFTDDPRIAVLSGKGDFVVVASESEVMALDAVTGARTWHVEMTGEQAFIAQTSDGGRVFLSGNPLRVLDAATGQDLATVAVANLSAFAVAYDGDRMAVSGDQMILTCHLSMRCSDLTRHPDPNSTEFLHLSPDGELLVALESPDESGTALATLYETSKWMMVKQRRLDSGDDILAASLDSFDLRLCSSAKLTSFDTYDNSLDKADETPFTTEVNACQFSGDRVVTLNGDHALRVWADNGSLVALAPARGNEAAVSFAGVRIAALDERRIKFWEVNRYGRPFNLPAFSTLESDGSHAVVGKQIVNLESGAATSFEPPADSKVAAVRAIAASHRTAVFWQRTTAQLIFAERHEIGAVVERWHVPVPDTSTGTAKPGSRRTPVVSISRDERFITVTTGPTGVWILDARNGAVVLRVANASQPVFVPARDEFIARQVTRGGRVLAAWPLPQGSPRDLSKTEGLGSGQTSAIAFSNDGTLFATAEAASDEETASGKRAWNVRVWEWPGLTVRRDLLHTAPVTSLTFGSDARTLLTATNSTTTIHAWDLETGEEFLRAPYTSSTLSRAPSMAFTPNRQLAFSDSLGVTVVPTETSQWIHEGCERITRNLSPEEWTLLVGVNVAYQKTCPNRP
jgi:WD40 repeat protein